MINRGYINSKKTPRQLQWFSQALRNMIPALLCFLLVCSGAVLGQDVDDSVITNSPLHDTKYLRSVIINSELKKCNVFGSGILESVSNASNLMYSVVYNSTVIDSVLKVTNADHVLDKTSTNDVFQNTGLFFLNRVFDSILVNATLDASSNCLSSKPDYNSSVYHSYISDSKVRRSKVFQSNLTEESTSCMSVISLSDIHRTSVRNSTLRDLITNKCTFISSVVDNIDCQHSTLYNSRVDNSKIYDSDLKSSTVSVSEVDGSTVVSSVITDQSKVIDSKLVNSRVTNSKLTNCNVISTRVEGKTWNCGGMNYDGQSNDLMKQEEQ